MSMVMLIVLHDKGCVSFCGASTCKHFQTATSKRCSCVSSLVKMLKCPEFFSKWHPVVGLLPEGDFTSETDPIAFHEHGIDRRFCLQEAAQNLP